ncbi:homoserine dehydrogenase [Schaalia sp. ZJ405]|uniref:homoserine dehydrogenase n=1 Tax=unclassified Schaalia TaxID=2691889 RepID=UPI0013EE35DE|nr:MULTISPECIES: homoserine dehydrogenase [unclassified Schaalia]QPK80628.1 homoserine dehydrogenase [Schaalia sp. ZJ405]
MDSRYPSLKVGVLGAGTVGSQVIRMLTEQSDDFAARSGARMEVARVLVRNVDARRDAPIDPALLTTSPDEAITGMDIVVELIGGIEPARTLVLRALNDGISVVTGNKALLAAHGPELYAAAAESGADLYYEAAVAGAVPVVYGLRESLAGDRITKVMGIVNGTTNFILGAMNSQGMTYEDALKKAQDLGFAEADPSADVDGLDAAAKCSILASLAFHTRVGIEDVAVEGITSITAEDMSEAAYFHRTIKLLAIAERRIGEDGREGVSMRVHPTLVPLDHPLAAVDEAFNAILVEGEAAGRLMFYGQGAGGAPTASAVLSDLVAAAHHRAYGGHAPRESVYAHLPILDPGTAKTRYQIRMQVEDRLGVLSDVAGIFARHGVSIQSVHQRDDKEPGACVIIATTHLAREADLRAVVNALGQSDAVREVTSAIRVEGE